MDNLSKEVGQLDLDCLFLHADEAVYSKVIFPLLGGCHPLLVKLKILHKKDVLLGMKDW